MAGGGCKCSADGLEQEDGLTEQGQLRPSTACAAQHYWLAGIDWAATGPPTHLQWRTGDCGECLGPRCSRTL